MKMPSSVHALRTAIRSELPPSAFAPRPWVGVVLLLLTAAVAALTALVSRPWLPWYAALLGSIAIGHAYGTLFTGAHDAIHGTIFRPRWAQDVLGFAGHAIFCISPSMWRVWHNRVHHHHCNVSGVDPDTAGRIDRFRTLPGARFFHGLTLGSKHPLSLLYFPTRLTMHHQLILWLVSVRNPEAYRGLNRRRAVVESLGMIVFWIALSAAVGLRGAFFAVLLPMFIANIWVMAYVATNHQVRPLTPENDPLMNTMSVRTTWLFDKMHLYLSHHVEHHLFPELSGQSLPLVRAALERREGDRYIAPSHWQAILSIVRTPRLYLDDTTLVDLEERRHTRTGDVADMLRAAQ